MMTFRLDISRWRRTRPTRFRYMRSVYIWRGIRGGVHEYKIPTGHSPFLVQPGLLFDTNDCFVRDSGRSEDSEKVGRMPS